MDKPRSSYRGSRDTYRKTAAEVAARWGEDEVKNYCPYTTMMTWAQWRKAGYVVRKNQKAIKSTTIVERTDENGNVIAKYPRTVNLFYIKQVEPINS